MALMNIQVVVVGIVVPDRVVVVVLVCYPLFLHFYLKEKKEGWNLALRSTAFFATLIFK